MQTERPMEQPGETLRVRIWRGGADGALQRYAVPRRDNQTVLDVVTWVQRHLEPALAYRFACRVGVCGSCAMTVQGRPRWTCRTRVSAVARHGKLTIAPLRNLPMIKDLVTDMAPFFENWQRAGGDFRGNATRRDPVAAVRPDSAERRAADAGIECINCAVCHAACEVVARLPEYLGPAALNRAWTLVNDARHLAPGDVVAAVWRAGGCHGCHSHGSCAEHCPVEINPTLAIAGLKRRSLAALAGSGGP